ncbi:hypothetical protein PNP85_15210 [Halobacterium salinarum]|uniref:hypothetical protein n=1 Tax=Halobacterium salinarum TaxID=2242 RepID=UPI00255523E3|nr:hypothetical protein [Halobacterium salinarum]MDL0136385.1 hypothetical protein [Halobacterium salinarum]MDL0140845.1 hypothetical protein [Halobacterium salinarum]
MPTTDFKRQPENTVGNIEESDGIHERNKELIPEYKRDRVLDGLSEATLLRSTQRLKILAEYAEKSFDEMEQSDVKEIVSWVH